MIDRRHDERGAGFWLSVDMWLIVFLVPWMIAFMVKGAQVMLHKASVWTVIMFGAIVLFAACRATIRAFHALGLFNSSQVMIERGPSKLPTSYLDGMMRERRDEAINGRAHPRSSPSSS